MPRTLVRLGLSGAATLALTLLVGFLLTGVLVHGPVGRLDEGLEVWLADRRTGWGNALTQVGTGFADPRNAVVILVVLVVVVALLTRRVAPPLFLAVAVAVESGIYFVASTLVARDRPFVPRPGPADPHASFPSGHSAASVCLYGGLAVLAWKLTDRRALQRGLTVVAVVIPPLCGFSRMYRGYHHLTDVLAGLVLGVACLALATRYVLGDEPAHRTAPDDGASGPTKAHRTPRALLQPPAT